MNLGRNSTLSVIVPVFNEELSLPVVFERLLATLNSLSVDWEILFIDNCSTDRSGELIAQVASGDSRIKYIRFSRNFGPTVEASLAAGYLYSQGDAAIVLYSDLQDPPELIPQFVEKWAEGFDVVYGVQLRRDGEALWRRFGVRSFYALMQKSSDSPSLQNSGDFKLITRRVMDHLNALPERARFSRGLIAWLGFQSAKIEYVRQPRAAGRSKANLLAITTTAFTGLTSFSLKPLRFLTGLGFFITLASVALMLWLGFAAVFGNPQPGLTTLACLSLLTLGLNMGALGLIGEYVGRIQLEVKQRPLFVVEKSLNL